MRHIIEEVFFWTMVLPSVGGTLLWLLWLPLSIVSAMTSKAIK